jgi:GTP diphosphokinase / guanosine-3',5'-bis(diphosphate) 3'-diphosphatase
VSEFGHLVKELDAYLPKEQIDDIYQSYLVASRAHETQTRSSGESYISHPLAVAITLAGMRMDTKSIMAALLHDVIEDTNIGKKQLQKQFGKEVAKLVDGVSKLTRIHFESHAEAQAENFRKMMMAMADDIRVILIKLADRLHNMQTLQHLHPEKRRRIARETLEIYAPIANRLGMNVFRIRFEELGFAALYQFRHKVLVQAIKKARGHRKEIVRVIESSLSKALQFANLDKVRIWGREKHLYSIYKKMKHKHLSFSEIMDVYAFRIIVDNVDECYRVLGVIHNLYKPLPEKFKDYIAIPKANGYQSLHTILFGPYGVPIEVQIRTKEMDKMAENGIASHWLYKSDGGVVNHAQERAREWIKGLLEIQKSAGNSLEFIEHVKIDLFPDEVYVFTPKGDIMELPHGATVVDFAYMVHSDVGNSCVAVKIDRRLAPLSTQLKNGQTVEIIDAPRARPNPDWLNFVVTGKARSTIRHHLKNQKKAESIALGKRLMKIALESQSLKMRDLTRSSIKRILFQFKSKDDLFEQVGLGNQMAPILVRRLIQHNDFKKSALVAETELEPLHIKGSEGMAVSFAKCCHPIPHEPITGVLSTGHGLVIHHAECKNLIEFDKRQEMTIPVKWENKIKGNFEVEILISFINKVGSFAKVALAIANAQGDIAHINLEEQDDQFTLIRAIIAIHDRDHLAKIIHRLRHLRHVTKVERKRNI